ncbi:MAG: CHASE2 domain-containing protein [Alphaproteobacteria bacterium]|nr:CHASE2 domain-containing protein [Alphaproteobacteria bacterium]
MIKDTGTKTFRALREWRPEAVILATVLAAAAVGLFTSVQAKLSDFAMSTVDRPASGSIVIVQIDPKSLAAIDTWPWPRGRHADLIAKLTASGADIVALDIAFSSPSTPEEDGKLAEVIRSASGKVVLPSFMQHDVSGVGAELTETHPLPVLRDGAMIGNANVFAPEGVARNASVGLYLPDGRYRPTFAGLVGQRGQYALNEFAIDFGIDLRSFKRLSYVDVLNGRFNPNDVKGKRVIVGATAIELGDRVPVPIYGVIAGVELQALIAESVWQGRTLIPTGLPGTLLLVVCVLVALRPSRAEWTTRSIGLHGGAAAAALFVVPLLALSYTPVLVETAPALAALCASVVFAGARELGRRANALMRERSSANLRRAMITLIVEESSDGVLVAGLNGKVELINERAARLLNATRTTMLGRKLPADVPRFDEITPTDADAATRQTEFGVECEGGTAMLDITIRRLTLPAVEAGELAQIDVYTLHDITARRRTEEAEKRAQEEKLMAEKAKSNFIANMSHELRTPLNAIIGFSEMMAAQVLGPVGKTEYIEYADVVAKSGHHLLALINNVLEISRIDQNAASVVTELLDFHASVETCVGFVRGLRDYKLQNISVLAEPGLEFESDPRLIKYVLINLLSNAVKFSEEGSDIAIRGRNVGGDLVLEISDKGIGIDANLMPHLTELFYQTDRSFTRKHEGMGVGLYLVKRHVDLLKGTLHIESVRGQGTTVRITLPGAAKSSSALESAAA